MGNIVAEQLGELYDAHASALVLYARQWCVGQEAEDVVHEAFVSLARQRRGPMQPLAWLYKAVRNASISASRSNFRRRRREGRVARHECWFECADERLDAQDATHLLLKLDPNCREVIIARVWGGLSFDEIAKLQGCSLATVYRRYQDGLADLHERLEKPWTAPSPTEIPN
jgi:RNA polymerase sigma-70 factor (ECF subfamily)